MARSAAQSCRQLLNETPRVALLSFSTAGSAEHPSLTKVRNAVSLIRAQEPDLKVEGEIHPQFALDCASSGIALRAPLAGGLSGRCGSRFCNARRIAVKISRITGLPMIQVNCAMPIKCYA
ncbi:phosphate acyltransferase [Pseudorhodobacter turbinis]|uniref:phosphate acyltransferase n=1 Tax=Pseudorhodobacter turbinis TaxID=2500533 RepID=UPI0023F15071|nr:phosphate acyltransferase [Pseudorhodobacter turbinis]